MKFGHLEQYRKLALFLYKYGTSDLVKNSGLADAMEENWAEKAEESDVMPEEMVRDLIDMGPAFVKLGQLLSTRPDLLPTPYIEALSTLQDRVEPFPFAQVEEIVSTELGTRISKAFNSFDEIPLASASLGQVHLAELRDGIRVVVKVQRPGIRKEILTELEVLESAAGFLERNTAFGKRFETGHLVKQFKRTLLRELNYLKEAEHMKILGDNLRNYPHLLVPAPIDDYTTDKVLTMQYLKGQKITRISPLRRMEIDGNELASELFKAYLQQIVVDGFMHADPHPGNVHLTDDNRIALLDLGMVTYIGEEAREKYLQLLLYLGDAKADKVAHLLMDMSKEMENSNRESFQEEIRVIVQENQHMTMQNLETGKLLFALIRSAGQNGFLPPIELSFVGKALLNLDQSRRTIAPDFSPNESIRIHAIALMRKHVIKDFASNTLFSTLLESKKFMELLPERLNKLFQNISENNVSVKVDAFDEKHLMQGFQKVANRITMGLIVAALLIASAMLMSVPSPFFLFGYPGMAILAFIMAMAGAVFMAIRILFSDE